MRIDHLQLIHDPELPLPSEMGISHLEEQLGAKLPCDYREFLRHYGGARADLEVSVTEPSPKGDTHLITSFTTLTDDPEHWNDIRYFFISYLVPRNVIYIGGGDFDHGTCLSFAGIDKGSVYYLDEGQLAFADETHGLAEMPTVREFMRLRDGGDWPPNHRDMKTCTTLLIRSPSSSASAGFRHSPLDGTSTY